MKRLLILILVAVFLVSSVVAQNSSDIDDTYYATGTNIDGEDYDCIVDVQADGDVTQWKWIGCGEYEGTGIQAENVVSVAWGSEDCGVGSYVVADDGGITGDWVFVGYNVIGSEAISPNDVAKGGIVGNYTVEGINPDGTEYSGVLDISANGDVFDLHWTVSADNLEYAGVAIQRDDILSVAWGSESCSIVSYAFETDEIMTSLWTYVGDNTLARETLTFIDDVLSGTYSATGTNPDDSTYECVVEIQQDDVNVYQLTWSVCGDFTGTGIQSENVLSVAWGGEDCGIGSYVIDEDGSLAGDWVYVGYNVLSGEILTPQDVGKGDVDGTYTVSGTNPDGSVYEGTLEISANGDVYDWFWNVGVEYYGVAIQQGDVMSVAWGGENCSIASYVLEEDGIMNSLWTFVGSNELGTESLVGE